VTDDNALLPSRELFNLGGRVALVTGAARGIGQVTARRLADAGAAVVVADISAESGAATVHMIEQAGGRAVAVGVDLSHAESIDAMVEDASRAFGTIDILVNNAALRAFVPWNELTSADWDRFTSVNLKAVFFVCQAVAKRMVAAKSGGAIVNIASTAAERPVPGKVDYNVAKAGVASLTRSLAVELGPHGIRVNAVGPGATDSQGGGTAGQADAQARRFREAWVSRLALRTDYAHPDDMARAILFLASPAARYITAQTLFVDAGYLAG
jgi:NAD(P)-dependent dehydrogenase (short-subunit alcohol dehydrogenase family)